MPKRAAPLGPRLGDLTDFEAIGTEFASESEVAAGASRAGRRKYVKVGVVLVAFLLLSASVFVVWPQAARSDASLTVESDPPGAAVRLNGQLRGRTPLVLTVTPGTYAVAVGDGTTARERRVTLMGSERASVYHVLTVPAAATATPTPQAGPALSGLSVITQPPGGTVIVDGTERGRAPLDLHNLRPGVHQLTVRNQGTVYEDRVTLEAGTTSRVVVGANPESSGGWLSVQTRLRLQVHKDGALIGGTEAERLMLPTGEHELTFSDPETGFSTTQTVRIASGSTTGVSVPIPLAPVNVNAIPWAEVWIDGERIGETPIGNHMLLLGKHDVELRHPQLGTKRMQISVSLNGPNRVAVNMREP